MNSVKFTKKIKSYAIVSFFVPLIAVNSCLLLFKLLGNVETYPDFNWDKEKIEYSENKRKLIANKREGFTLKNCPKYFPIYNYITTGNQTISFEEHKQSDHQKNLLVNQLIIDNKIKSVIIEKGKTLDNKCIKNYQLAYLFIKKFDSLNTILLKAKLHYGTGFSKIKNPYFYGEVSISRTARSFPAIFIFKTLIILSAFLLFLYWKNNLNLFSELKNKNYLIKFSKKFFYFGLLSCIFLTLHATFLGLDFDSKWFGKMRRLIIILFILFEVLAQILLTKNLFKFREVLKKYIRSLILKLKIIFVLVVFFITCVAFIILVFGDPSTTFKHMLEWNYFSFLLIFYLLSRLLWK